MDFPQIPNTHAMVMLLMTGVALFLGALAAPTIASVGTFAFYLVGHGTEPLPKRHGARVLVDEHPAVVHLAAHGLERALRLVELGEVAPIGDLEQLGDDVSIPADESANESE